MTLGGALGRWMFHCHIFFHGHHGMMSELVVTAPDGKEKPNVNVGGSWAYAPIGGTATRQGTFVHRDGLADDAHRDQGDGHPRRAAALAETGRGRSPRRWAIRLASSTSTSPRPTPTAARTRRSSGSSSAEPTDGSDKGDPHIRTVDGKRYDFQAAGEFTLLRDREGMEIQVRQTPVETPPPITDSYSGLTDVREPQHGRCGTVGSHRIAYQPYQANPAGCSSFWTANRLSSRKRDRPRRPSRDARSMPAARPGSASTTRTARSLTVTPHLWTSYGVWLLDVSVSHTNGDEGLMGRIPQGHGCPRCRAARRSVPCPRTSTSAMSRSIGPSPTPGA